MGARLGRKEAKAEALRRLAEVDIEDPDRGRRDTRSNSRVACASGLVLAAALAGDPELLIADEPATALDVTTQAEILELLKSVQRSRGMGLIMITHDLRVAFSVCRPCLRPLRRLASRGERAQGLEREPLHPYFIGAAAV